MTVIFKTAGLLLLAISSVTAGFLIGGGEKKKRNDLLFLIGLLTFLKREIVYSKTELPLCYSAYNKIKSHPALDALQNGDTTKAVSLLSLPAEIKDALLLFFDLVGKGTVEEETARCGKMLETLEETEKKYGKDLPGKLRVSRTLGICIGAVILLLFL